MPFATPNAAATPTTFGPPASPPITINAPRPYIISGATTIATSALPTILTGLSINNGALYQGGAISGSASQYLFGASSSFDLAANLDNRFGKMEEPAFASGGVAVFSFTSLQLAGNPLLNLGVGVNDLALIGKTGLISGTAVATLDFSSLHSLFLGSSTGAIYLESNLTLTATGTTFRHLDLFTDGSVSIFLRGALTFPNADIFADSTLRIVMDPTATIRADRISFHSGTDIITDGTINTNFAQLFAGGTLTLNGALTTRTLHGFVTGAGTVGATGNIQADYLNLRIGTSWANGPAGGVLDAKQLIVTGTGASNFSLNSVAANGTVVSTARLTNLDLNVNTVNFLSDFAMPGGTVGNITTATNIAAAAFSVSGFNSITTHGSTLTDTYTNVDTSTYNADGSLTTSGNAGGNYYTVAGNLQVGGFFQPHSAETTLDRFLTAGAIGITNGISFGGAAGSATAAPGNGFSLRLSAPSLTFDITAGAIGSSSFDGGDATSGSAFEGGSGGTVQLGTDAAPITGNVTVNRPISASTGANGNTTMTGGNGGTIYATANGTVAVSSTLKVSDSAPGRASKSGGNIALKSNATTGTAISVSSSAQLLSLLSNAAPGAGGLIKFTSAGGAINMSGTARADKGTIELTNNGPSGVVNVTNANLAASTVKARALGSNGTLNIGGGSISADAAINLYAGGSNGTVNFTDNVTLSGTSVKTISGNTVNIFNGKVVNIQGNGSASVFTNTPNYTGFGGNGSTTGTFGGSGATTAPLSAGPGPGG